MAVLPSFALLILQLVNIQSVNTQFEISAPLKLQFLNSHSSYSAVGKAFDEKSSLSKTWSSKMGYDII
jgi:hypothetical protein